MLKSRSDMDKVFKDPRESFGSLFRGYIPLGSRDIQFQSFETPLFIAGLGFLKNHTRGQDFLVKSKNMGELSR